MITALDCGRPILLCSFSAGSGLSTGRWGQSVLGAEFIELSAGRSFHALANFVDVGALHVVEFAIVPNELDIGETLVKCHVLLGLQFCADCA